ncbi:hypothetical protein NHG22_03670 [Streptomyces sp. ATE26]|uniref:hypothetical protein n=1 Tax=Streptomyces sp. ATE26 TaxID=2954237 RepID=UPI00248218BF|nr:hypothetical protein [Streptomyces sp. ATE26]MDI1452930.1 hypothetical protein [Streptomyces sp. ATE26]
MTRCIHGDHDFPIEDHSGAYCPEHGVTMLWTPPNFAWDDLLAEPGVPNDAEETTPSDTSQDS